MILLFGMHIVMDLMNENNEFFLFVDEHIVDCIKISLN